MERQMRLGTFIVTFSATSSMAGLAQAQGASVPAPPPSKPSDADPNIAPGGGVTWAFVGGLVIGLVVGYVIGRNSVQKSGSAR